MIRLRPAAFIVAAWILGATTSIGVGLLALTLVGEDLRGDASLPVTADAAVVDTTSPVSAPPPTTGPAVPATAVPGPSATSDDRRLTSTGGDVVARCGPAGAYLVYWTPAQGFRADDVVRGPAPVTTLTFEGARAEVKLRITCAGGIPQLEVVGDDHDDD